MFPFLLYNVCDAWAIFQEDIQGWRLFKIVQLPIQLPLCPNKQQLLPASPKHSNLEAATMDYRIHFSKHCPYFIHLSEASKDNHEFIPMTAHEALFRETSLNYFFP